VLRGTDAIRAYFAGTVAPGRKLAVSEQCQAVISGDLALTSTRLPDGTLTAESLPRTTIRGRPLPGRRRLALDHRQVLQRVKRAPRRGGHPVAVLSPSYCGGGSSSAWVTVATTVVAQLPRQASPATGSSLSRNT
jgi:hypothetical protein